MINFSFGQIDQKLLDEVKKEKLALLRKQYMSLIVTEYRLNKRKKWLKCKGWT